MGLAQKQIRVTEKLLARLEQRPWNAIYRILVGFVLLPLYFQLSVEKSFWTLAAFFVTILVLLRLVPAVLRRMFRFSDEVQSFWKAQRQIAKRYDSFQWQKLFWIGLGLVAYLLYTRDLSRPQVTLTIVCLVTGALGLLLWIKSARALDSQR